uniref:Reverse transcriptase Ty1/copia-type domain-containing protein n=1 Tax=Tanacetum cinerariifolium TaxID=118510 RepID=A0A6L2JMY2_TANCI|nr:hypothetical protein [Tanacetum cinerariifolium]
METIVELRRLADSTTCSANGPYFKHPPDPWPDEDSKAGYHGSENRSPHVDDTEMADVDNTSFTNNSEATHDEDDTETSKLPTKLYDFVLDDKVKYKIGRVVNYSKLSKENYCFASKLNKTFEPKTFHEACNKKEWVGVMNSEMEALNRNKTWEITQLPLGRKPIGPDISYAIHSLSQFMHSSFESHLKLGLRILRSTRRSVTGFAIFIGISLVLWKTKKQTVVSRSSTKAKYKALAFANCEVIWLTNLLQDLNIMIAKPITKDWLLYEKIHWMGYNATQGKMKVWVLGMVTTFGLRQVSADPAQIGLGLRTYRKLDEYEIRIGCDECIFIDGGSLIGECMREKRVFG